MPPKSYILTVLALLVLVVVSIPLTMGFSIIAWYWLFAIAACALDVLGVLKIARGLGAPAWIQLSLAAPGIVWAARRLSEFGALHWSFGIFIALSVAAAIASLAAGAAALNLIETNIGRHWVFRVGYGVLAFAVLMLIVRLSFQHESSSLLRTNTPYIFFSQSLFVLATFVKYGALIAAAIVIASRYNIERWTCTVISLVGGYLIVQATVAEFFSRGLHHGSDALFWLQPVIMLIGAAAVWRMGCVLRAGAGPAVLAQP